MPLSCCHGQERRKRSEDYSLSVPKIRKYLLTGSDDDALSTDPCGTGGHFTPAVTKSTPADWGMSEWQVPLNRGCRHSAKTSPSAQY